MSGEAPKRSVVRLPREQRMREIEAAARNVFSMRGYHAASINEIAREAGVSEGAIYKFYATKLDLLHTILRDWYQGMIADFKAKLEGVAGARAQIHVVVWQHLKSIKEHPELCRLFYSEVRSAADYYTTELHEMNREYTGVLVEILKDGIASGELRPDISISLVRDVIFGGIEHRVSGFLMNRGTFDFDEVALQLSDMVYAGIAARTDAATQDLAALVQRLERAADRLDPPSDPSGSGEA